MRTRKTVTKQEIIKALKTEPLRTGEWVRTNKISYEPSENPNCTVCAVGAVLRGVGFNNQQIDSFGDTLLHTGFCTASYDQRYYGSDKTEADGLIESALNKKKFLHALSIKFEAQAEKTGCGKKTRKILIDFVKANFPSRVPLNAGVDLDVEDMF